MSAPDKRAVHWVALLARGLLVLLLGVFLLFAAVGLMEAVPFLGYLSTRGTVFDAWGVLSLAAALLSLAAIAGACFAIIRRRWLVALLFAGLALPAPVVIEGSRCDTAEVCRAMGWAALPSSAFDWKVRIRPVTDPNEATVIASEALLASGSEDFPYKPKRFEDHWIVAAIDQDGWPGERAVRIDTRTAKTSLVACPAATMQCGMERSIVSDGRRVFRNTKLGLEAIFPAARPVCTARSKGEPSGFNAQVRATDIPCDIIDDARQLGLEVAPARKNARTLEQALTTPCGPLSPETAKLFKARAPTFPGRPSLACEFRMHGQIQISVYAFATTGSNPEAPSRTLYEAYIVSTPVDLAEDARTFDDFLRSVRIGLILPRKSGRG